MKRFTFIAVLVAIANIARAEKPNIVVIMADDMGYGDAGFTGAKDIRTPNLDKLAATGVVFANGYANHPFCGPSRAALLSGRYQHRFGFETNPAYDPCNPYLGIDPREKLFPKRLQEAGYVTGGIGKWHLGAAPPFHPNNRGFDYYYGFLGGGHDYFRIDLREPVREAYLQALIRNDKPAVFEGYLTTALSEDAARFVERNKDKPFFLYVAYNAPHAPLQAPKEAIEKCAHIADPKRRVYAAMVEVMDAGIGLVLDTLERHSLRDNTLVFFLSDNGGPQPKKNKASGWNGSSNKPFRGGKGNFYDGGVHVPFVASWPARFPQGVTFEPPVIALDIARTAVAVAGGDAASEPAMEGADLVPFVLGEKTGAPHDALYWRGGGGGTFSILTSDRTKYVRDHWQGKPELYHLPDDIAESADLIAQKAEVAKELNARWKAWNETNVPSRIGGYKDYHRLRDQFFLDSVPEKATEAGFSPKRIGTFK